MIEVFTGKLGGGKSYHAVSRIARQLAAGGMVVTNIDLVWEEMVKYCADQYGVELEERQYRHLVDELETMTVQSPFGKPVEVEVSTIYNFHSMVPKGTMEFPVLCVIDEAHLYFNSRDYAVTDKLGRAMLAYLSQSRKVGNDLILIVQDWRNLDAQFIRQIQYLWKFLDLSKFFIPGIGIKWISEWPVVGRMFPNLLSVQMHYDGVTQLGKVWERKDPKIYPLYRTDDLLRPIAGQCKEEFLKLTLKRVEKPKNAMLKFIPLIVIVCLAFGARGVWNFIHKNKGDEPVSVQSDGRVSASPLQAERFVESGLVGGEWVRRPGGWLERTLGFYACRKGYVMTEEGPYSLGDETEYGVVQAVTSRLIVLEGYGGERLRIRLHRTRRRFDEPAIQPLPSGSPGLAPSPVPPRHELQFGG